MKRILGIITLCAALAQPCAAAVKEKPTQKITHKAAVAGVVEIQEYVLGTDSDGTTFEYFTAVMPWPGFVQVQYFDIPGWLNVQSFREGTWVRGTRDWPALLWEFRLVREKTFSSFTLRD